MSSEESNRERVGVFLFFAIGVSVGLWATAESIDRGRAVIDSIFFGACYGTMSAWVGLGVIHHGLRALRRVFRGRVT